MKKVLITGGLGFIFSHVTEYFVKRGYEVVVIDNCSTGSHPEIVNGSFKFYNADLSEPDAYKIIIEEKPNWIIHAAAITDVDFSIANPRRTIENNVMATLNVFKGAKQLESDYSPGRGVTGFEKLLYVNSDEVYGECEEKKTEEDMMFPRNPYSASKAMCSFIRTSYDVTFSPLKDKTAEIRMCNVFGPRQDTRKIMPNLLKAVRDSNYSVSLQEEGIGYREYLYVKNIPPIIELILEKGNRVYNITNNDGFTVNELIKKFESMTGKRIKTHPATRPSHDRFYRMNNERLKSLGWNPLYNFEQGLSEYNNDEAL